MKKLTTICVLFLGLVLFCTGAGLTAPLETQATSKKIIVIDPGHGGNDPGAISASGTREKDVVLTFAQNFKSALEATGRYQVYLTRDTDRFLTLDQRVKFAREKMADLFVAVHADTVSDASVRGATVYTVSDKASDAEAAAVAQKENRADIITGVDLGGKSLDVSNVLINLAQRESRSEALKFANQAVREIKLESKLTSKPIRSAAFVVLKAPDVASVLVELGYLSNAQDEADLRSSIWQAKIAADYVRAVDGLFAPMTAASQP